MNSSAWKIGVDAKGVQYGIQINEIPWKFRKPIEEAMKDWRRISYGWNCKTGNQVFIYQKTFKTQEEWEVWARSFPLEVKESRWWGEKEKIILHKKERK